MPFDNLADSTEKCDDVLSEMELDDVVQGLKFVTIDPCVVPLSYSVFCFPRCHHSSEREW